MGMNRVDHLPSLIHGVKNSSRGLSLEGLHFLRLNCIGIWDGPEERRSVNSSSLRKRIEDEGLANVMGDFVLLQDRKLPENAS